MSYSFASASTEYLDLASAPTTTHPLTIAMWVYPVSTPGVVAVICTLGVSGNNDNRWQLYQDGTTNDFIINAKDTVDNKTATGTPLTLNAWNHVVGVFASNTSRTAYLNGTSISTNTGTVSMSGMDSINIGSTTLNSLTFDGRIAEANVWTAALTQEEITSLSKGFDPNMISPDSLVTDSNLFGTAQDLIGGTNFTEVNTPTPNAPHPAIIQQTGQVIQFPAAVAIGGYNYDNYYRTLLSESRL